MATTVSIRPSAATLDRRRRLGADVVRIGTEAGLAAVGIGGAGVFEATRATLHARRRAGLHGGMQFTYRNPDRSTDPSRIVEGARSLVVGAWGYRRLVPDGYPGPGGPGTRPAGVVARYARRDHYASLRAALGQVARRLQADGWQARVVVDENALVDRAAAQRAGLGWYGRNSLLLLPGRGSWFVLGSVVTDAPLERTPPSGYSSPAEGCGSCHRCVAACPTGALMGDGVLDARRCLAWLLQAPGPFPVEHRAALGGRIYGCDACQEVCPVNRAADRRRPPAAAEADTVAVVDLLALLGATDEELLVVNGRWYLAERDPRYLRRNALVALGNVGDGRDRATAATVARWAGSDDALLAEHARWASARLGLDRAGPDAAEAVP
ncbi:MAG TPA: tRNA epoxyqueuosine(34) reductase QueG [Acidimicrobiales bacterium]|nr:tRNA epoxyqueuosine(34) reductase QueG [Acidimicrobiales bacterium]